MRTVAAIEARMRSTRLSGKVLRPILGRPMLERMVERLQRVRVLDGIIVATTTDPSCDPIAELAGQLGVGCFRGSEEDVLGRVLGAARAASADVIVETTGDCPLLDPEVTTRVVQEFRRGGVDYCANILERTYPRGLDVQVFPVAVLAEVDGLTKDPRDREHVSLYIYEHPERFRLRNVASGLPPAAADLRLTVDTPEDYRLVCAIYEALYPRKPNFGLADILRLVEERPALAAMNRHVAQKQV